MSHPLTSNGGTRYLYTALITDDPTIANAFVLTAVTLIVTRWAEDGLTEQSILLRTESTVVDGLGFGDLTI
jgi:hypothetical protein